MYIVQYLLFRDGGGTSTNIKFEFNKYSYYLKYSAYAGVSLIVVILIIVAQKLNLEPARDFLCPSSLNSLISS
jgi:hypothetical protein